ncbi:MAG: hypothetical protein V7631_1862 [Massilia sp.]|jgi:hypothetical protein
MHRLITFACMLIATVLWIAGFNTGSVLFLAAAGAFELVFWMRLLSRRT